MTEIDAFIAGVRQEMESAGRSLARSGLAARFVVEDDDGGLTLAVIRAGDERAAQVTMTGTTEAYLLRLDDSYRDSATAYDDESKLDALRDHLGCVEAFVRRDYYEEIGKRGGHMVHRTMYLSVPGGIRTVAGSVGRRGFAGLFGYRTLIVRPSYREGSDS